MLDDVKQLRDEELLAGLARLLRDDRALTVQLLVHIGEVDKRGLYREHAYASMFEYAVDALHMSESEAYLSAVKLLAPVLTAGNCEELLQAARLKSKRQVEIALAQRYPKPDVPGVIRKLPAKPSPVVVPAAASGALSLAAVVAPENSISTSKTEPEPVSHPEPAASLQLARPAAPEIAPLRAERYKVQFTANQRLHDKLKQAQDLLRHQLPDGDIAEVVERALDLLIAERMKQRFALVRRPRAKKQAALRKPESRHIPHEVRRQVIARDGLRCSFVSAAGKRCEQRGFIQLHHEEPYGRGGPAITPNIRTLCSARNQLLAEQDYGRARVQRRIANARSRPRAPSFAELAPEPVERGP